MAGLVILPGGFWTSIDMKVSMVNLFRHITGVTKYHVVAE